MIKPGQMSNSVAAAAAAAAELQAQLWDRSGRDLSLSSTHQNKLRKQLQTKLWKTSKVKPNQKTKQEVIDQAAQALEIVNGPQGKSIFREDQIYQYRI